MDLAVWQVEQGGSLQPRSSRSGWAAYRGAISSSVQPGLLTLVICFKFHHKHSAQQLLKKPSFWAGLDSEYSEC